MNIVVLIKGIGEESGFVMNYDDANNLEAALGLKENRQAAGFTDTITAVSLGPAAVKSVLRGALAVGADRACLVETGENQTSSLNCLATAQMLSRAVKQLGPVDLLLAGYQSQDNTSGAVGPMVAELLGIPQVTHAQGFQMEKDGLLVEKNLLSQVEEIRVPLPCMVSNVPAPYRLRGATYMGITEALEKELIHYPAKEASGDVQVLYARPAKQGRLRVISRQDGDHRALSGIIDHLILCRHSRR